MLTENFPTQNEEEYCSSNRQLFRGSIQRSIEESLRCDQIKIILKTTMITDSLFNEQTESFLSWLTTDGKVTVSSKIKIEDLRSEGQGRCIIASKDIDTDELLFEIPRSSILNVTTSQLCVDFPHITGKLMELSQWDSLIICMMYEMKVLQHESRWSSYFNVLPSSESLNTLMYWNDKELSFLTPSLVVNRVGKGDAETMYRRILDTINEFNEDILTEKLGSISWEEFLYIPSIIMAYSFDVEIKNDDDENEGDEEFDEKEEEPELLKSMIPLADTLNADTHKCNANLTYDKDSLKMLAIKPIKKGEQVYNTYGELPNSELLRKYGYVEWGGSQFDYGEVPFDLVIKVLGETFAVSDKLVSRIIDILREDEDIQEEEIDIVMDSYELNCDNSISPEFSLLVQVLCIILQVPKLDALDILSLTNLTKRTLKKCIQLLELGKLTKKCVTIQQTILEKRLAEYNVSKEMTKPEADDFNIGNVEKLRHKMANEILINEYQAISKCLAVLKGLTKTIDDEKLLKNVLKRKIDEDTKTSRPAKKGKK
ncbi:ribosomal lysine N-methyltransferase NDAI_0H00910 [Naumovozyma dairenensis CBS 421]|uniref:Ribosomal lysine N-methyltransferase 4 n=1 Tax=Naumovozyma dairenensis (strain ATCC 10597 / BCRC 20456 / CBS 421 / NBRC 0211 / NRRL Y-12639) TaxID=1071378 RepID=G0WEQ4_NAUDC|nr:hypothetical protein NDAI_0H00910 [Naumovozyma dairenensis CBS 421]CCD26265.1 hypothetical protein NDAI_0H00910 [Naumovozyma dairenensis CBS 421]